MNIDNSHGVSYKATRGHISLKEYEVKMGNKTLRQQAEAWEPRKTLNISELKEISTELDVEQKVLKDSNGEQFDMMVINVDGQEYRVPVSVTQQLNQLLEEKPSMTKFKVKKSGEGMNTSYTVIALD